jgi:hypothetical protein
MGAQAINLKRLWDEYYGDTSYLNPVKCNTPFEYYDNDPEFVRDAKSCTRFVAQRLGASGLGLTQLNISDLTVYAAFEEAVTTYGNLVYQYKIRDSYINIEGSPSAPFNNNTVTYVNSIDINTPVTWSRARLATWSNIDNNAAFSQSIVDQNIYVISASVSDFVLPNEDYVKSLTFATEYYDSSSLQTIEDVAEFIADLLDEQNKGNLTYDLCLFWDSNGSIPCKMSDEENREKANLAYE